MDADTQQNTVPEQPRRFSAPSISRGRSIDLGQKYISIPQLEEISTCLVGDVLLTTEIKRPAFHSDRNAVRSYYPSLSLLQINSEPIVEINLELNNITHSRTLRSLSTAIGSSHSVQVVNLHGNNLGDEGAASLARGLRGNTSITELNLSSCGLRETSGASLASLLLIPSLTQLNLRLNQLRDEGALQLARLLAIDSSLTWLDISGNYVGHIGGCAGI
jgi:Ran GTPase-activating protein (RanGAP) involved in mRNA processing and transport